MNQIYKKKYTYKWSLPDEAHRYKNIKTLNSVLLQTVILSPYNKVSLLSATICDKPDVFSIFGYVLKLYLHIKDWNTYLLKIGGTFQHLHDILFPSHATRIYICDLGPLFPSS